jgi:hypothetical protein
MSQYYFISFDKIVLKNMKKYKLPIIMHSIISVT